MECWWRFGTAAQVLTSNGAGTAPTWQAAAGGGGNLNDAYHYGAWHGRTITADEVPRYY